MNLIEIKSPAKLNLHLQVLNRRLDGFHNISSLFTLIDITDGMSFKRTDKYIDLVESTPIKDNIVQKAAMLLKENYGVSKGVTINLSKSIPDQKGLGGGSSNAASTLLCLNKLWGFRILTQRTSITCTSTRFRCSLFYIWKNCLG